jgi:cytolysin (calcineurin-like family phosphatase)
MIWVSWPKKSSGVPTGLTDNVVREIALALGLVDVKVCAIDEIWSGLKFVIPTDERIKNNKRIKRPR